MGTTTIDVIQSAQITALQDDVVELKDKLNAAVAELNKAVADIAELRTQEVNTIADITELRTQEVNTITDITNVRTQVVNVVADITELRNKLVSNRALINDIRTDLIEVQDVLNKDGSGTYSQSGGSTDGVLKKINRIEQAVGMYIDYGLSYNTSTLVTDLGINQSSASVPGTNPPGSMSTTSTTAATDPAAQTSSTLTAQSSSNPAAQSSSNPAAQTSANASNASVTGVYTATGTKVVTIQDDAATRAREVTRSTLAGLRR